MRPPSGGVSGDVMQCKLHTNREGEVVTHESCEHVNVVYHRGLKQIGVDLPQECVVCAERRCEIETVCRERNQI